MLHTHTAYFILSCIYNEVIYSVGHRISMHVIEECAQQAQCNAWQKVSETYNPTYLIWPQILNQDNAFFFWHS